MNHSGVKEQTEETNAVAILRGHEEGQPLVLGQEYCLAAGLEVSPDRALQPQDNEVTLMVTVHAVETQITPERVGYVTWRRGQDRSFIEFMLTPQRLGRVTITVEFYYLNEFMGQLVFELDVVVPVSEDGKD